jgi:multicomponent Na+:H+ antiporter subunit G
MQLLGNVLIVIGLVFIFFGVYGILRFKNFYSRILITSKVDTVGFITLMIGIIIKAGMSFFSLKVLFIIILAIITNPISTHAIARSAYISGYRVNDHYDE